MILMRMTNLIIIIVLFLTEASAECNHGEVRLEDGCVLNEGRVEICTCTLISCSWGTVCDDYWGRRDAQVVCRQLGYRPNGAQALMGAYFGRGCSHKLISLDNVRCNGREMALLECNHNALFVHDCHHGEDAGVRCTGDSSLLSNGVMNVSVNNTRIISTHGINLYAVLITWKWQKFNNSMIQYQPNSFQIECFSDWHHIGMSVNSTNFSAELLGLLPSTSYNCCVSAVYGSHPTKAIICTEIATIQSPTSQPSKTTMSPSGDPMIGGVLGFIIGVLLISLALSGAAIVYLLRLRLKSSAAADRSSPDVPLRANMSYTSTPPRSTTSGPQATRPGHGDQTGTESETADEYSRIGPSYTYVTAQVRRQQPTTVAGRNRVSAAELSERYEFSEAHLTAAGGGDGDDGAYGVLGGEVGGDVQRHNMQIEERDEYSHLQY